LRTLGRVDFNNIAEFFTDQRTRKRRGNRKPPVFNVGFMFADNLVNGLLVVIIKNGNRRTEHDAVTRQFGRINDVAAAKDRFQFFNTAFDKALLFLGVLVLGIFGQVTMRACFGNRRNSFGR